MSRAKQIEPSETAESIALAKWLEASGLPFTHVANGKHRTEIEGYHLKLMGVQPGFPDYLIFEPTRAIYSGVSCAIELKRRSGGRVEPEQEQWLAKLAALGWIGIVARGCQEAVAWASAVYQIPLPYPLPFPRVPTFTRIPEASP
jgi:hypothetical protein